MGVTFTVQAMGDTQFNPEQNTGSAPSAGYDNKQRQAAVCERMLRLSGLTSFVPMALVICSIGG